MLWIELLYRSQYAGCGLKRLKSPSVCNMYLEPAAEFSRMLLKSRQKMERPQFGTGQPRLRESFHKSVRFNKGRPAYLKRPCRAAPFAEIGRLQQAHTRIDRCGIKCRHIRRRQHPWQSCIIKPHS